MSDITNIEPIEKILKLQQGFKGRLSERISDIEYLWLKLCEEKSPAFNELYLDLHTLVGTAGTFGATLVSNSARKLENKIKLLMNNELILNNGVIEEVNNLINQLHVISKKWQPSSIPFIPEKKSEKNADEPGWQTNICLVEDDEEVAFPLVKFLEQAGYNVFYYREIKEFEAAYRENERAAVIIMDMAFNEGHIAGAETIKHISENDEAFPPVIFISVHEDIQARLAAAQAGARRYFTKPIVKQELLSTIDGLTHRIKYKPYRVLLIDDDEGVLEYYSALLKNEGMDVLSFTNPFEAYPSIKEFEPELIVLDLYMPECSGFDLAKVIRLDDDLAYVPIVFLSSELDVGVQLSAMGLGGDDFLMKSVDADYFIQAVTARVKRSRRINNLNEKYRDALRESEYRLITLDQHAIISMTDTAGIITFANEHFSDISGYSVEELVGKNHNILKSGKHSDGFYKKMWETLSSGEIWRGQICNRKKNGGEYWVEATIVPFMDENGLPYKYVSVRTDITEVKLSEEDAKESEKRLLVQQDTLNTLSTVTDYILLEEEAFFSIVTQRVVEVLKVARVSIWMLDENNKQIICRKLFDLHDDVWSSGFVLKKDDYPKYFLTLENNTVISASNALTHPATSGFSESYLIPQGIGAMLYLPIRKRGLLIGVICCEHVGGVRNWCVDEKNFVLGLADLVSLNIESSERKIVEQELAEAKKQADDANKAKSEFLSSMSHELRTPMNAISGFAQLLMMEPSNKLDDIQKSNVKEIINASSHLLELINEILNLAKIESGNVRLSVETVNSSEVIMECFSLMEQMIESRNIKTTCQCNGKSISFTDTLSQKIFIHVDRIRFKQILLNLLSNAVKYNVDGGSITIACDILNDVLRISVIDTGKGISKEDQNELFKSFSRLGEENGSIEGTGIGLVITKKLVKLMSGQIGVDSELNKGSTFWVEFPFISADGGKNIESVVEHNVIEQKLEKEYTILYVEDNPANLRLVEQILLSKENIKMISAHEPYLGLELANSKRPDLILLDINLPGMDGFEVLKKLRASDKTKNIPVFAISANAMLKDIEAGIREGFDDYITKPIDVTTFFVAIMKALKNI
ncbi:MAG: response regulator [Gammaproteobacteria bacterium]|nr:response regulator [Gammaproteobacteria bacterium]